MTISDSHSVPHPFRRSRTKLWLRTGILLVFGVLFTLALARDAAAGRFHWSWGLTTWLICLPLGLGLSRYVPMQVHLESKHITLSFDKLYFGLILLLVIAKAITGRLDGLALWSDFIMCVILGLMMGRLSGICLRVRALKTIHNLIPSQAA